MPQLPRGLINIMEIMRFEAEEDVEYQINASNIIFLMPIWKWNPTEDRYQDALGFYDLCMSKDGLIYHFYSRTPGITTFAYRYVSPFFPASALQERTVRPR